MKRIPALLILLLLSGCVARPSAASPEALSPVITKPEPTGFYDPDSALEAQTHGALRCYPLGDGSGSGILAAGEDILLFSDTESGTVITKLAGNDAVPTAQIALPFSLSVDDPSLHPWGNGFSCFDPVSRETVTVDENLQIQSHINAPADMTGVPILSQDGSTLYYSTASAIRGLDLVSGISRVIRQSDAADQQIIALLRQDTVLQCTVANNGTVQTRFLSIQTGNTLHLHKGSVRVETCADWYFATLPQGSISSLIFGTVDRQSQAITFPQGLTEGAFLPENRAAVGFHSQADAIVLDYYDLITGRRTAVLSLPAEYTPEQFLSGPEGGTWFLAGGTLFYWNNEKSAVSDPRIYTAPYHLPDSPDATGMEDCLREADKLSSKYGISIQVQPVSGASYGECRLTFSHQVPVLLRELEQLESALGRYPPEILQILSQRFDGLSICIVNEMNWVTTPDSPDVSCSALFWENYHAYIALTVGTNWEKALNHALCHLMDTIVLNESSAYDIWSSLNPTGFAYDYDYTANQSRNSTAYLQESNRYFVDMFSMSFPKEDRARILECAMDSGNGSLFQSAPMQAKLTTLCLGIREAFGLEDREAVFPWEQHLY